MNKDQVTRRDLEKVSSVLEKLTLQGEFSHMKLPVQTVLGGLLVPELAKKGVIDPQDPDVIHLISEYSKEKVEQRLSPAPILVKEVVEKQRICRRDKRNGVNKEKRFERKLEPSDRDVITRWWNANQRLIPKDDPICADLSEQINALRPKDKPLSAMQISGYLSALCRLALRTEAEQINVINRNIRRHKYTVRPIFSPALMKLVEENWEFERKNEKARSRDLLKMRQLREEGDNRPFVANF
jgi:hypothetical protein